MSETGLGVGDRLNKVLDRIDELVAENAELRQALSGRTVSCSQCNADGPGTPLGILRAVSELAERECGHNPMAAKPALVTIAEWITEAKWELARFRRVFIEPGLARLEETES